MQTSHLVRNSWDESSYSRTVIFASWNASIIESLLLLWSSTPRDSIAIDSTLPCKLEKKKTKLLRTWRTANVQ